jgi:hypothetical protein
MVSCTCFDTVGLISIKGFGVARCAFAEQVMFSSLALSGEMVSWLMDVDSNSWRLEMSTLSLSLDKTIPDLDHVILTKMSISVLL